MKTPNRRRQLKGLVLHHQRHPAEHRRRLVNRTTSWGEPPVNGICRWCYELTASPGTRWHRYCLKRLSRCIRPTSRRGTAHALRDVRRSVRRDGPQAGDRGSPCAGPRGVTSRVHAGQPALALPRLPQAQDRSGQVAGEVPVGVLVGLARRTAIARSEPRVAADVSVAVQPGACSAAGTGNPRLMVVPCRHEVPDSSSRRCALCGACLQGHRHRGPTGYLPGLRQDICRMVNAVNSRQPANV